MTATQTYQRFRSLPGSEYIASRHAVAGLARLLRWKKPRTVLEVGSGIGTLTYTTIKTKPDVTLFCTEDHDWCRSQLSVNLLEMEGRYRLFRSIDEVPMDEPFDLLILDGGDLSEKYFTNLGNNALVFVEGLRANQREVFERSTARPFAFAYFFSLRDRLAGRKSGFSLYVLEPSWVIRSWFAVLNLRDRGGYWLKKLKA